MAMTSTKNFDSIQWDADGMLWVREVVVVTDGPTEVARTFLRTSYAPGDALPDEAPAVVKAAAALAWTPEVIADYAAKRATPDGPEPE
jgi:hypothetical protein